VFFNAFSLPADNSTYSAVQNFGHFVLFVVLGYVFLKLILELVQVRVVLALLLATGILVALGLGIELFQKSLDGRTASLHDLVLDIAGMLSGYLLLLGVSLWRQGNRGRCAAASLGIVVLTSVAAKPMVEFIGFDLFRSPLPIVRDFRPPFAVKNIEAYEGAEYKSVSLDLPEIGHRPVLRVEFSERLYSGVIFHEFGSNWSDYQALSINIFSVLRTTRQVELRINDRLHNNQYSDRYNGSFSISPGLNNLLVPLESIINRGGNPDSERRMDIDDVSQIQFFSNDVEPFAIYIVKIELR